MAVHQDITPLAAGDYVYSCLSVCLQCWTAKATIKLLKDLGSRARDRTSEKNRTYQYQKKIFSLSLVWCGTVKLTHSDGQSEHKKCDSLAQQEEHVY